MVRFSRLQQGSKQEDTAFDALLLPNTDHDIIKQYKSLPERAYGRSFGLIEEELVFIDTETSGLDLNSCELIQVAAIRMMGDKELSSFNAYIKPSKPISQEISELTGISNELLEQAQEADLVLKDFADFVAGSPVVAHNASFDRAFLEKQSPSFITEHWVDSLTLARIALPRFAHHRLSDLVAAFALSEQVSHNAMDDARALAALWRILLTALSDLPAGLLVRLSQMHAEHDWSLRPIFSHLAQEMPQAVFSLSAERDERLQAFKEGLFKNQASPRRKLNYGAMGKHIHDLSSKDYDEMDEAERISALYPEESSFMSYSFPSQIEIEEQFSSEGLVGKMYENYEQRTEQLAMAQEVNRAFSSSSFSAIEAGTGVGKSIAYLVPSLLFALKSQTTVAVATKTNALMDQLMYRELPLLSDALYASTGEQLRYLALKGYEHYPCLRKLERFVAAAAPEHISDASLSMAACVLSFACQSSVGDLDLINLQWSKLPKQEICTTAAACHKKACPFFAQRCFIHGQRKNAALMDIVITNHALMFRNVASDFAILPAIRHWIMDEAHALEAEARKQWALRCSKSELDRLLNSMLFERGGSCARLEQIAKREEGATLLSASLTKLSLAASPLRISCFNFYEALSELKKSTGQSTAQSAAHNYDFSELWVSKELRESAYWAALESFAQKFYHDLEEFKKLLAELLDICTQYDERESLITELQFSHSQIVEQLDCLRSFFVEPCDNGVYSLRLDNRKDSSEHSLSLEFLDLGKIFAEDLYPELESVVFTSATIAVGKDFSYFCNALGLNLLPQDKVSSLKLKSSYDYDHKMGIIVPTDLPEPNTKDYLRDMAEFLLEVHQGMQGSVLTLFTNRKEMEYLYEVLAPQLAQEGLQLICQKRGTQAKQLRDMFIADKSCSLFALKSFWEGFDAQGDTLRCVVIPKLPFPTPNNPLSQERRAQDRQAWFKYDLPESVIAVKQAAGRLIRSSSDTGCLILADRRVLTKAYGASFLRSMPKEEYQLISKTEIKKYLEMWHRIFMN